MIIGNVVSGPWAGSGGLGGFEQGTDFNCTSTMCYGVTKSGESKPGAVHQTFVKLQRAINRWSGKAKFTSITEDGFIGHSTVDALQKAGGAVLDTLPIGVRSIAKGIFAKGLTKENVATNAVQLAESLNSAADQLEAAGSLPKPLPVPTGPAQAPPKASPPSEALVVSPPVTASPDAKSGLIWWLLGGFAVVATAGIATVIVLKRRRRKGSVSMSYGSGRY